MSLINGGILNAAGGLALTGNLSNGGIASMVNGIATDILSVSGDYTGNGNLQLDVDFATDSSDVLNIAGNVATSTTSIALNDISTGSATGNDVLVVDVTGTTVNGDFTLAGGTFNAGAYSYDLLLRGTQYFLVGTVNAVGSLYESAPYVFQRMMDLPTLEQRVGHRQYLKNGGAKDRIASGTWMRVLFDKFDVTSSHSTSRASIDGTMRGFQFGYDTPALDGGQGEWVLGLTGQLGSVNSTATNTMGSGTIEAEGLGLGATITWYGDGGLYFDAQTQVNWIDGDYSDNGVPVASGKGMTGQSASAEVGYRYSLSDTGTLIPQAQIMWSQVDADRFTDTQGSVVDLGENDRLSGRLGLAFEYENQEAPGGPAKLSVIGNLLHDFSDSSHVNVSGAALSARNDETWIEVGLGGSKNWNDSNVFFGEVSYRRSLDDLSNTGFGVTAGVKVHW